MKACVFVWFSDDPDPEGQGFCQAGFSVDFTKVKIAAIINTLVMITPLHTASPLSKGKQRGSFRHETPFRDLWTLGR